MGLMLSPVLREVSGSDAPEGRKLGWWCPGCERAHVVTIEKPNHSGARWIYDERHEAPTIHPSYHESVGPWSDGLREHPKRSVCHCWIKAGEIKFLGDCAHKLANLTVRMIPWPEGREG